LKLADCLFCKIVAKELDAEIVDESDGVLAFRDINPMAPTHILVIPKRHLTSAHELSRADGDLLGEMFEVIAGIAESEGIGDGHRVVTNVGAGAGQAVWHLHFHVLGGRALSWPPG
jgi:histidine triad (HIT) family protein